MKRMFLYLLVFVITLGSCNNPMSREFNRQTFEDDMLDIREEGDIGEADISLLIKYALVQNLSGNLPEGDTYEEILDRMKELNRSEKEYEQNEQNEQFIRRQRMRPFLDVKLLDINYTKIEKRDCMVYTVEFRNLSDQNINTIIGNIRVSDKLEKEIKKIEILLDSTLQPNSIYKKTYAMSYDHNNENDKRIRTKNLIEMLVEWNPDKILFEGNLLAE